LTILPNNDYMKDRLDDQIEYFDKSAIKNQQKYKSLKSLSIICNILTTMTIAVTFTVPDNYKVYLGLLALVLSTTVLATYQWEEFHNFGAKWEKFRLVAEQLRSEKYLYLNNAGKYSNEDFENNRLILVNTVEEIIKGTDISYFSLIVEPGQRIEKRMKYLSREK